MRPLTVDFAHADRVPYFLWDEDLSVGELRALVDGPDCARRDQVYGKMLREARDVDVWQFTRPAEVRRMLPRVERRLGRRLGFWRFLIDGWVTDGLVR